MTYVTLRFGLFKIVNILFFLKIGEGGGIYDCLTITRLFPFILEDSKNMREVAMASFWIC